MKENNEKLAVVVAGGNGAGKSTFINHQLLPLYKTTGINYINADDWQKKHFGRFDNTTPEQAIMAQKWAESSRKEHLDQGKSFITETVFSHPSKIELLKDAKEHGFTVDLYHISLDSTDKALDRISERVLLGGHDVDSEKVKQRYERVAPIVKDALKYTDRAYIYDNSVMNRPHQLILELEKGQIKSIHAELPNWVKTAYKEHLDIYYSKLQEQLSDSQKQAFKLFQDEIRTVFKDHPGLTEEKLNELNTRLPDIVSGKIKLPEISQEKEKDRGR